MRISKYDKSVSLGGVSFIHLRTMWIKPRIYGRFLKRPVWNRGAARAYEIDRAHMAYGRAIAMSPIIMQHIYLFKWQIVALFLLFFDGLFFKARNFKSTWRNGSHHCENVRIHKGLQA